jgi:hypothetical protein
MEIDGKLESVENCAGGMSRLWGVLRIKLKVQLNCFCDGNVFVEGCTMALMIFAYGGDVGALLIVMRC